MATPTHCTDLRGRSGVLPLERHARRTAHSSQIFSIDSGPNGAPCPGQIRPFEPRLVAGTIEPGAGAFSDFTLKLDRDDGDQFLGDLNFTMPPGLTGDLRGITYCPEASIAAAAQNPGGPSRRSRAVPPRAQIGTTNVAAGPGSHPFHAVGKMYLAGPVQGRAAEPGRRSRRPWPGPTTTAPSVVRVALHVDPLTAQVSAVSDTVPQIIGGIPIRMRSIQVNIDRPELHDQPDQLLAFAVDSQGIGDQGTVVDFSSYFHAVNCAPLRFKPTMTIRQLGGRKAHRGAPGTPRSSSTCGPAPGTPTSSRSR